MGFFKVLFFSYDPSFHSLSPFLLPGMEHGVQEKLQLQQTMVYVAWVWPIMLKLEVS